MFFFSHLHICKSGFFSYYYFPLQTSLLLLRHCLFFSSSFIPYLDFFPFSFFHSPSCSLFFLFRLLFSSLMHNFIPLFSSPFCLSSFLSLPSYSYSSCYPRFPIFFHSVITSCLFFPLLFSLFYSLSPFMFFLPLCYPHLLIISTLIQDLLPFLFSISFFSYSVFPSILFQLLFLSCHPYLLLIS